VSCRPSSFKRIGVPATVDPYGSTTGKDNKVPGVWKYNWK